MTAEATAAHADAPREPSGWAPLRTPAFRRLWTAQFVSNVGSWMQTVAAQWVMTSLTTSALLLSAISAAGSIPVLLLAIPSIDALLAPGEHRTARHALAIRPPRRAR